MRHCTFSGWLFQQGSYSSDRNLTEHFPSANVVFLQSIAFPQYGQCKGQAIFSIYSTGVHKGRDDVVYDFNRRNLSNHIQQFVEAYNGEVDRYKRACQPKNIDDFLRYDTVKWSRNLKRHLVKGDYAEFQSTCVRRSLYRPFTQSELYFSDIAVDELGHFPHIFPTTETETENRVIVQ